MFNNTYVRCDDYTCKHNAEGHCDKNEIEIKIGWGRVSICKEDVLNICADYEGKRTDEED